MPALRRHRNRPLTASDAISQDKEAAGHIVRSLLKVNLRECPISQINQAVTGLYRAGVRVDMRSSMPGKILMGQLHTELERRTAAAQLQEQRDRQRPAVAPGAYSLLVNAVARAYRPKQYSTYA